MKKAMVIGAASVAVFAGVFYLLRDSATPPAAQVSPPEERAQPKAVIPQPVEPVPVSRSGTPPRPVVADPRLAALMVSPDNAMIDFVVGSNGKVIKEIDKDPSSPGFGRPLREYSYAGEQVAALTVYRYLGNQVQVTRTMVSYRPDGTVDQYRESTSYE